MFPETGEATTSGCDSGLIWAMDPMRRPPIGFAHRGARAHAPENTLEAFRLALRLGATGLESDVWLTADGVAVLDHDGAVGLLGPLAGFDDQFVGTQNAFDSTCLHGTSLA